MMDTIVSGWTWRADTLAADGEVGLLQIAILIHENRGELNAAAGLVSALIAARRGS